MRHGFETCHNYIRDTSATHLDICVGQTKTDIVRLSYGRDSDKA